MGLTRRSSRIWDLEHNPEVNRPMLAYIKGDTFSLAIDAGYSASHVLEFYSAIEAEQFVRPDFTVLTHRHFDHTFGLNAIHGISIAYDRAREFLQDQQEQVKDPGYIDILKKEDAHFRREYVGQENVKIVLPDITFSENMTLDLGVVTARLFHTVSPHSDDTVCIFIPEEKVLF